MPTLSDQITAIHRFARSFRAKMLSGTELLPPHIQYIIFICREPGITQEMLVRRLNIGKSNVTRHLATLEEIGYLYRRPSEADKRMQLVYPTDKAFSVLPLCLQIEQDWNQALISIFNEKEQKLLDNFMCRLNQQAFEIVHANEEN